MNLLTNFWFIQFIGLIALIFIVLAWNARVRVRILNLQSVGAAFFIFQFILLGALTGVVMNGVTILRNSVFAQKDKRKWANSKIWLYVFIILSIAPLIFIWEGWPSILPALGLVLGTYGMSRDKPKQIRFYLLLASLVWIPYMIIIHSYSGLLNYIVTTIGLLVGMYRLDRKQSGFEKIIPTAWMVAYRRTFTDIPFSQEIFQKLEEIRKRNKYKEIPSELKKPELTPQFEARYKLIDKLVYQSGNTQILELAAGFSSRGLFMSKEKKFNYVEIDLPIVIKEKEQLVKEVAKDNNFNAPSNLHFEPGNVLDSETFKKATQYFDKSQPITIINEGLLRYLTKDERAEVAANIHQTLKEFSGVWITSDISLRKVFSKENTVMHDHVKKISELTGKDIIANRFETEEEAKKFFENLGFPIERYSFMEVHDSLYSPKKHGLLESQVKDLLEDAVVFVMEPA